MYSYLIPKILYKKDITQLSEDGNPGCGNVFSCVNIPCGILCLILELAKGAIPIWLAVHNISTDNLMFAGVMAAPVLGHAFSPMMKNHGGKAIAVTFGTFIGLVPQSVLLFLLAVPFVLFSTVLRINPHSLRVMISYSVMVVNSFFFENRISFLLGSTIITVSVIYRHLGDFVRREKHRFRLYFFSFMLMESKSSDSDLSDTGKL